MAEGTVAFADEGVRAGANPPLYLIAATVVPAKAALSPLESMLPKGATKLHWRDMGPRAQRQSLACIAQLGTRSTVVAASPIDPRRQERARRKDLEALLPLLEAQGVTTLVMESRFPAADAKDASHFQTMVRRGLVSSIELHFADPAVEHRLWIPDQILGAYAESAASYSGSSPHQQPSPTSARSGGTASSWAARRQPSRWGSGTCAPTLAGCTRRASYAPSFPACRPP